MKKRSKTPREPDPLLDALAPAAGHLAAALVEVLAAANSALEAFREGGLAERLPEEARSSLSSARASLELFASMAATGADAARRRARETVRGEALAEILAALDSRAETLKGPAREALDSVRDAVAGASRKPSQNGSSSHSAAGSRGKRVTPKPRRKRKIPIVLDRDPQDE